MEMHIARLQVSSRWAKWCRKYDDEATKREGGLDMSWSQATLHLKHLPGVWSFDTSIIVLFTVFLPYNGELIAVSVSKNLFWHADKWFDRLWRNCAAFGCLDGLKTTNPKLARRLNSMTLDNRQKYDVWTQQQHFLVWPKFAQEIHHIPMIHGLTPHFCWTKSLFALF